MKNFPDALQAIAITLWVGALWVTGYIVAPLLFANLPDRVLAGHIAGKMFEAMAYLGLACGAGILLSMAWRERDTVMEHYAFWIVVLMLLITMAGQFGIQPLLASLKQQALPLSVMDSPYRGRFAFWHGVSRLMHLVQSILGLALVLLERRQPAGRI